jgi:phenylalanyl-tRNA synthetase beta chain
VQLNISHAAAAAHLFEIGRTYLCADDGRNFTEKETLALVLWGDATAGSWCTEQRECDYYDGASVLTRLFSTLGIADIVFSTANRHGCHPGRTAEVTTKLAGGTVSLGRIAELDPRVLRTLDIRGRLVIAEIDLEQLVNVWNREQKFEKLPRYPSSSRDIAMLIPEENTHADITAAVTSAGIQYVESITVFDLYHGEQVPEGQKSMAYRVTYRAPDRTLTDEEVDAAHQEILGILTNTLDARIR